MIAFLIHQQQHERQDKADIGVGEACIHLPSPPMNCVRVGRISSNLIICIASSALLLLFSLSRGLSASIRRVRLSGLFIAPIIEVSFALLRLRAEKLRGGALQILNIFIAQA